MSVLNKNTFRPIPVTFQSNLRAMSGYATNFSYMYFEIKMDFVHLSDYSVTIEVMLLSTFAFLFVSNLGTNLK